jgi:tRNA (cmo5U34)-methyltransferase
MSQIDKDRFFTMARTYDRMAEVMVPQYNFIQDQLLSLLPLNEDDCTVIDLGAGSGIMLEKILSHNSAVRGIWIDYSDDFLEVAQERLTRFADRVEFVKCAFEDDWESQVDYDCDAIISMSAIHHLDSAEKREIYQRCYHRLRTGGWFFNADEMKTAYADAYFNSLRFWAQHADDQYDLVPVEMHDYRERWFSHFDKWKQRNIVGINEPKIKGDDMHDDFMEQLGWLREIGFVDTDLFIKYHLWSVIGGRKPAE